MVSVVTYSDVCIFCISLCVLKKVTSHMPVRIGSGQSHAKGVYSGINTGLTLSCKCANRVTHQVRLGLL